MGISPQSQRSSTESRGTAAQGQRGKQSRVRSTLKSDRQKNAAGKPTAQLDQFGSRHNEDNIKGRQRTSGRPSGQSNLAARESAQETQPDRGSRNKQPGSRTRKSGSAKHEPK